MATKPRGIGTKRTRNQAELAQRRRVISPAIRIMRDRLGKRTVCIRRMTT